MFKVKLPTKIKSMIKKDTYNNNCLYIYKDRIEYTERKKVKISKNRSSEISILHVIPFENEITFYHNKNLLGDKTKGIKRLVVRNPSLLLDGISRIEIYYGNDSNNMRKNNITCNSVYLTSVNGMKMADHTYYCNGDTIHSTDILIQDNNSNVEIYSCEDVCNLYKYDDKTIIHDTISIW